MFTVIIRLIDRIVELNETFNCVGQIVALEEIFCVDSFKGAVELEETADRIFRFDAVDDCLMVQTVYSKTSYIRCILHILIFVDHSVQWIDIIL